MLTDDKKAKDSIVGDEIEIRMLYWHWEGLDGFRMDCSRGFLNSWAFGDEGSVLLWTFGEEWKFLTIVR